MRRVNDMLRDLCAINGFGFICNDLITTKYLWKNGIHLQDLDTSILSKNVIEFVNNYLFSNSDDPLCLNKSHQTSDFDSDIDGLINLRKAYQNNPLIWYIDLNSLIEKIVKSKRGIIKSFHSYIMC